MFARVQWNNCPNISEGLSNITSIPIILQRPARSNSWHISYLFYVWCVRFSHTGWTIRLLHVPNSCPVVITELFLRSRSVSLAQVLLFHSHIPLSLYSCLSWSRERPIDINLYLTFHLSVIVLVPLECLAIRTILCEELVVYILSCLYIHNPYHSIQRFFPWSLKH